METRPDLGAIITPAQGNIIPRTRTMIDNGCFTQPDRFDVVKYRALCQKHSDAKFATVPDVVGDWDATLTKWELFDKDDWPCPLALVIQDGATGATVPWGDTEAIFIGGSTEWKLGADAALISREAKERGLWVHMGRVNSCRRLQYADFIGCDSADGTYLIFGPDINLPKLVRWLETVNRQQRIL